MKGTIGFWLLLIQLEICTIGNGQEISSRRKIRTQMKIPHDSASDLLSASKLRTAKNVVNATADIATVELPKTSAEADGMTDFLTLMSRHKDRYVDKTLFIKKAMHRSGVNIVTRPRGFGKTLMLSTLEYFLDTRYSNSSNIFKGLNILTAQDKEFLSQFWNKHPVIRLDFSRVKGRSFKDIYNGMKAVIAAAYVCHMDSLLHGEGKVLEDEDKIQFKVMMRKQPGPYETAIRDLSKWLFEFYNVRPIILFDEYDTPVQSAFEFGHYPETVEFMKSFYTHTLSNQHYEKCLLTGVTNIHTNLFKDFTENVTMSSILDDEYSEFFGFTRAEVKDLVGRNKGQKALRPVENMYNGYSIGKATIFNPLSVSNYLYYPNSRPWMAGDPQTGLEDFLLGHGLYPILTIQRLLFGERVTKEVLDNFAYPETGSGAGETAYWAYLLQFGFLTYSKLGNRHENGRRNITLRVPNGEVRCLLQDMLYKLTKERRALGHASDHTFYEKIMEAYEDTRAMVDVPNYEEFVGALTTGDFEHAQNVIRRYVKSAGVYFNPRNEEMCPRVLADYVQEMLGGVAHRYNSTMSVVHRPESVSVEVLPNGKDGIPVRVAVEKTSALQMAWVKTKEKVCPALKGVEKDETEIWITCGTSFAITCLRKFVRS